MTTTNKQQTLSPYQITWLCVTKKHVYTATRKGERFLKFSKQLEKEFKRRGFVEINGYWCKSFSSGYDVAAERAFIHSFIVRFETIKKRSLVRIFYINDKQFGLCHDCDYFNATTQFQKDHTITLG